MFDLGVIRVPQPVAFWRLGDLTSSVGDYDLTNSGGVTFDEGKIGDAAYFASGATLQLTDMGDLETVLTGSFSMLGWLYITSGLSNSFVHYAGGSFGPNALHAQWTSSLSGTVLISGYKNGSTESHSSQISGIASGAWHFIALRYDHTLGRLSLTVNDATNHSADSPGSLHNPEGPLTLGGLNPSVFPVGMTGRLDAWGIWDSYLSDAVVAKIRNNGSGREF